MQLLDLEPHLGAELGIEVGERLVKQEDADLLDQGPADGDALALAARELAGLRSSSGSICSNLAAQAIRFLDLCREAACCAERPNLRLP